MMKKTFLLTIVTCIVATLTLGAQTQQGYVKTKGRLGSNGKVIPGQRLPGATVQILGRSAVVSGQNGAFSFQIPSDKFFVQSVKKQGYVLVDPETTSRTYTYSSNPLILVMETQSQQAEDKLANERKIRHSLQRQLQAKEDEIEALKREKRITLEEYQKRLEQLYANQENNEKLISDMAKRYSQIDFDQMDELNLRISDCILNGRLTEADSLLRSKGDINGRIARLNQHHEANLQGRQNLEKSEEVEQKNRTDIAQDCYNYYQKFALEHQIDSAAYYLELCASIDTANVMLQITMGAYSENYLSDFPLALSYYQRGLTLALEQGEDEMVVYATLQLGECHFNNLDYLQAEELYKKALSLSEQMLGKQHDFTSLCYCRIGDIYRIKGDISMAVEYYQKAAEIQEHKSDSDGYTSTIYYRLGSSLAIQGKYAQAAELIGKALRIDEQFYGPDCYSMATGYCELGEVYMEQGSYPEAQDCFRKALNIYIQVCGSHNKLIAYTYDKIGIAHTRLGEYDQALDCHHKAFDYYNNPPGENNQTIANTYLYIGEAYRGRGDHEQALESHQKALEIYREMFGSYHYLVAFAYIHIGMDYEAMGNTDQQLEYYKKGLECYEQVSYDQISLANTSYEIAEICYSKQDYRQAIEYYNKAYGIYLNKYGEKDLSAISMLCNIGTAYKHLGEYQQALEYYMNAYPSLKESLGEDDPRTQRVKQHLDEVRQSMQP